MFQSILHPGIVVVCCWVVCVFFVFFWFCFVFVFVFCFVLFFLGGRGVVGWLVLLFVKIDLIVVLSLCHRVTTCPMQSWVDNGGWISAKDNCDLLWRNREGVARRHLTGFRYTYEHNSACYYHVCCMNGRQVLIDSMKNG